MIILYLHFFFNHILFINFHFIIYCSIHTIPLIHFLYFLLTFHTNLINFNNLIFHFLMHLFFYSINLFVLIVHPLLIIG